MENKVEEITISPNINIPVGWELKELGELFVFKNGVNASKEIYGNGVKFINLDDYSLNLQ